MANFSAINLSDVPAPAVIENIEYAVLKNRLLDMLQFLDPNYSLLLESDPAVKLLEIVAYLEMLLRQRVNDAAHAVMLPFSTGTDLENLAAYYGVTRAIVEAADDTVFPPKAAIYETDARLRMRTQLAPEKLSGAGSRLAYMSHTYDYDGRITDVAVLKPEAGRVWVVIMDNSVTGAPPSPLLTGLVAYLREVGPLTDDITATGPEFSNYSVSAQLRIFAGPDKALVVRAAVIAARAYIDDRRKIGQPVRRSGLIAALKVPGVEDVVLNTPVADVIPAIHGVVNCNSLQVTVL